ncbi:class I SAM-dependent methyltransferase [Bacillaceae bacterium CLA-AA-H227]|uniref:Class I SAM-dependent methyltransferase n=2 Tax=Robertmurraya TaxID=2837507 RepID=A0A4U1CY96_9BACI|nr:class I SAM-dependent methyltransferase [Robertmurraya kyonggiensis]TKC15025.1 class I SAM-dependent methyltransferase [Robertmurraya kyonggiensis]
MNTSEEIKKRYNRISGIYEMMDRMIKEKWRVDLLSQVSGEVLEVGIGTGVNLQYYSNQITSLTGIDFSRGMLEHAKDKVISGGFEFPTELREADIQDLPFPDDSFDSIVSTCVFCSVPDPIKGLMELRRVCKPTGQIYMLEHMRSDKELIGLVMDVLNPLTVRLWGANVNRDTIGNIERADLKIDKHILLMSSIFRELTLSPDKKIIETP